MLHFSVSKIHKLTFCRVKLFKNKKHTNSRNTLHGIEYIAWYSDVLARQRWYIKDDIHSKAWSLVWNLLFLLRMSPHFATFHIWNSQFLLLMLIINRRPRGNAQNHGRGEVIVKVENLKSYQVVLLKLLLKLTLNKVHRIEGRLSST